MSHISLPDTPRSFIAYDPGGTTGYAIFERNDVSGLYQLVEHGAFETWVDLDRQIPHVEHVVYEIIKVFHPSFNAIGLEVIGVIKYLCGIYTISCSYQTPGTITGIKRWKRSQLLSVPTQHARDAISHGVMFVGIENVELSLLD